jgi:hypothetical protein
MVQVPLALAAGAGVCAIVPLLPRLGRLAGAVGLALGIALGAARARSLDLHDDVRGEAFAHDLVTGAPDGALLLLSGDAPNQAALYVCAVEHACGARVPLAPGSLFLPWAMAQTRRRHPDVAIPWASGPALAHTHELAALALATRPVLVYPDLVAKDPLLQSAFRAVPDRLLFRLWPEDADSTRVGDAFTASAKAMEPGGDCEGCALPPPAFHPTQEMQLLHAYEAAATNRARAGLSP